MVNSYQYFKTLSELTTDEEILAFVKANRKIESFTSGDKIGENEYFVYSVGLDYVLEEDYQELVDKYFVSGYVLTQEELDKAFAEVAYSYEHDIEHLPSAYEFLECAFEDGFDNHPMRKK